MRRLYWYLTASIKKHGLIFVVTLILAVLFFSLVVPSLFKQLEKNNRHYVGIIGEFSLYNLPEEIKSQISGGLTIVTEDGSAKPLLAERWTVEQEGTTYRFVLKNGLYWHDGKPVTTEDIRYQLPEVETIITPNDIVFKLPAPFAPFPVSVAEPLLRDGTLTKWKLMRKPTLIGIGEHQIADYTTDGRNLTELVVEGKNDVYIYRFYLTEDEAVTAFKQGEVDVLEDLAKPADIMEWQTNSLSTTLDYNQYLALFFNFRHPLLQKNIRQAFAYAITKPDKESRAIGPISPDSWAYLSGGKSYNQDQERAVERLLDEVPPQKLVFNLTTTTLFVDKAESIKQELESVGAIAAERCENDKNIEDKTQCENLKIEINIHVNNFPDKNEFDLLLIGQQSPYDPDQYALWHSGESKNFTGYKNTRIDSLLEKARQTHDTKERNELYQEFQQFFLEDAPAVFLEYLPSYRVERS